MPPTIKKNQGNDPYLPVDTPVSGAGGEAPAVVAPASREAAAMANTPPGVPPRASSVDREATVRSGGPRSWDSIARGAAAVQTMAPGDDRLEAAFDVLHAAMLRAEADRGTKNQYGQLDIWDKNKVSNQAGTKFGRETGVLPGVVEGPVPNRDRPYTYIAHSSRGVPQSVGEVFEAARQNLIDKEGLDPAVTADQLQAAAMAALDPADVAFLRQQAEANPKLMEGVDLASPEADTILRGKLLEGRLLGNLGIGHQVHFHGRNVLGAAARNMKTIAGRGIPELDAVIDMAYGVPGHAAFLRGSTAAPAAAGGGAAPPPPPPPDTPPVPPAPPEGPGWMGQARDWATEVNPKAYNTLLGQLPNWQHLAGGVGAGAGLVALLAALGQPQDDNDAYLAMLAARNAAPAPAPY